MDRARSRKRKRFAFLLAFMASLAIVAAVVVFEKPLREQWWLWRLESGEPVARDEAALALGELKSARAVVPLIAGLEGTDDGSSAGARALVMIGRKAVPALIREIGRPESRARVAAARILAEIGPDAEEAVPALIDALLAEAGRVTRSWGPEQATGKPDTPQAGDIRTAWASMSPDGRTEWLLLEFEKAIVPAMIHIHETFNPGAAIRVSTLDPRARETVVWSGADPARAANVQDAPGGAGIAIARIPLSAEGETRRVRIYFDSKRVSGWNEIDAVGLEDPAGTVHWAVRAIASSSWANQERSTFESAATEALERIQGTYEAVPATERGGRGKGLIIVE